MVIRSCHGCGMPYDVGQTLSGVDKKAYICPICEVWKILEPLEISQTEKREIVSFAYNPVIGEKGPNFVDDDICKLLRRIYPAGSRVELIHKGDENILLAGMMGTVIKVDGLGSIRVHWDNGIQENIKYGMGVCKLICTKQETESALQKIGGKRFLGCPEMKSWFRKELKDPLPTLELKECGEDFAKHGLREGDYSVKGTFGRNIFGMEHAEFTVDYVLDNEGRMLAAFAGWN